jgi:glycogen debranching enzyme
MEGGPTFHGEAPALDRGAGLVTLVNGSTFCLSGPTADIHAGSVEGLFFLDRRFLSRFALHVDGRETEGLAVHHDATGSAQFVVRQRSLGRSGGLLIVRHRKIGKGLREQITVYNHAMTARSAVLMLSIEADFAELFSVKRGTLDNHLGGSPGELGELAFVDDSGDLEMVVESSVEGARGGGVTVWPVTLEPGGSWTTCIEVSVRVKGEAIVPVFRCGENAEPSSVSYPGPWFADAPQVECSDERVQRLWSRSVADLGSLVLADPLHPSDPYVAAGAPWFMTLYGRDSLWAGWMALPCGKQLLLGVMRTLARLQGRNLVFDTEENPGRILHEVRTGSSGSDAIDDADIYYGSTDVTPLFVIMAGELLRWGASREDLAGLLPAVDHAIHWIEQYGDLTGDGFIETQRTSPTGLINQGWKDSWDSVSFANGRLAGLPVALIEVQAYVYAAYRARAELARHFDDEATAANCDFKADAMRERVIHEFWLGDEDGLALARDPEGQRVDAIASNQGHALWAGLLDGEHAAVVARRLMSDDIFSGFGLRTLATGMGRYDPVSYHNGSVWPHDTAITAVGLARNGFHKDALRLVEGLVAASSYEDGRLPELFSGLSRRAVDSPVPYPTSCSPQAWAAGAGLLLVRLLAGIEPELHLGRVNLSPLWQGPGTLEIDELRLGDVTVDLVIDDDGSAEVIGGPPEVSFHVAR